MGRNVAAPMAATKIFIPRPKKQGSSIVKNSVDFDSPTNPAACQALPHGRPHGGRTACFDSSHGVSREMGKRFLGKIGFTGNLYDTGYGFGSKEMRSIGILTVRPTGRCR